MREKGETKRKHISTSLIIQITLVVTGLLALLSSCNSVESAPDAPMQSQAVADIRYSYRAYRTTYGDGYLSNRTLTAPACIFYKTASVPQGSQVKFFLDGVLEKTENEPPYEMGGGEAYCVKSAFTLGKHVVKVTVNGVDSGSASFTYAPPPSGATNTNITACADINLPNDVNRMPGNVSNPAALAPDGSVYVTTFSGPSKPEARPVILRYANGTCSPLTKLTTKQMIGSQRDPLTADTSHDAPSVFVDGGGHIVTTYYGRTLLEDHAGAPYFNRARTSGDLNSFEGDKKARLLNYAELQGFRMQDGKVFIAGEDQSGRFEIMNTSGGWETASPRQVVENDTSSNGLNDACKSSNTKVYEYNRHTKAVFHQGQDGNLYVIWGYSFPLTDTKRSDGTTERETKAPYACQDLRHYTEDSHEVFFAYSSDGGDHWQNAANSIGENGSQGVVPGTCTASECTGGIASADVRFRLNDVNLRQGEHRKIWVEADGRVNIAFVRSNWCTSGTCLTQEAASSTFKPGALMYLSFYPGQTQTIKLVTVNSGKHKYLPGIRVEGGKVYIWGQNLSSNSDVFEYVSSDRQYFTANNFFSNSEKMFPLSR